MRINRKTIIILIGIVLILMLPCVVLLCRDPVLIVTDMAFIPLYGKERLRSESITASFALFRPVKSVIIDDDAGDDIVPFAIDSVSKRPYCVIFPLRFAASARMYREQFPDTPVIILEGKYNEDSSPARSILGANAADFFLYNTDIDTDFYLAGLSALIITSNNTETEDEVKNTGRIVVFLESGIRNAAREAFLRGVNTLENPPDTSFHTSYSQFSGSSVSCAVIAGTGTAFMESNENIPIIFFTWLDPELTPDDVVMIFDDSPPAQAVTAVRMAFLGQKEGQIPSKIIYKNTQKINKRLLHKVQK